jgi:energy-coupling factor transporter ATP-binding protein EcfA2
VQSGRWIRGVRIESFRGVPGILELDFGSQDRPPAVVILGDNGSGKSSIVDALQFALQLQIQRERGKASLLLARCGLVRALPAVSVHLSDGSDVERRTWYEDDELRVTPNPPGDFARTPLVLRRADILRFWDTPAELRQLLFVHFFSAGHEPPELPQERQRRLKAAEIKAKAQRRGRVQILLDCSMRRL